MTPKKKKKATDTRLQKYIDYIINCGGSISRERFREDWEPIGGQIMCELIDKKLVGSNDFNLWINP